MTKKLGLFLCCAYENEKSIEQFENAFPKDIRNHASSKGILGYEYNFEKMNFLERAIIKKISGTKKSVSNINYKAINKFVNDFEKAGSITN